VGCRFLVISLLVFLCLDVNAQFTYDKLLVDYDNAWEYKNLKIIPIRPKGIPGTGSSVPAEISQLVPFREAIQKGYITVQERGSSSIENVHWLSVYNNSDKAVYIASGELLEGGRQDRVVSKDTILLAKAGRIDLPVMCVEEGRWSEKDKKFVYKGMANSGLRKTLDVSKNQVLIWKEIDRQLQEDSIKAKTLSYLATRTDKKFVETENEYLSFFRKQLIQSDSNIVGVVCVSGDRILGSDIFLTTDLFLNQSDPLLLGYIDQAISKGKKPEAGDDKIKKYMDQILTDEKTQKEFLQKNGKQFFFKNKLIHISSY
jgi:hypothetical protein